MVVQKLILEVLSLLKKPVAAIRNTVKSLFRLKHSSVQSDPDENTEETDSILKTLHNVIKDDNAEKVKELFVALDDTLKQELLNGTYKLNPLNVTTGSRCRFIFTNHKKNILKMDSKPLFQSLIYGSLEVFRVLQELGASVFQQDENGFNIIHYLIVAAHHYQEYENKAVEIYEKLARILSPEEIKDLLMMEDKSGLRPLELSVHACSMKLFDAIFNTSGVYLVKIEKRDLEEEKWFDITDYEAPLACYGRGSRSPLYLMTYLDEGILKNPQSLEILHSKTIQMWTEAKLKCNILFIFLWFLIRVGCFLSFYSLIAVNFLEFFRAVFPQLVSRAIEEAANAFTISPTVKADSRVIESVTASFSLNITEADCIPFYSWYFSHSPKDLIVFTLALSYISVMISCSLVFDIISLLMWLCTKSYGSRRCFNKKKTLIVYSSFYRIAQFLFMISCLRYLVSSTINATNGKGTGQTTWTKFLLLTASYLSTWSILYFVQLLPSIGHCINIIQRMQSIMINFIIIFIITIFPFPHVFLVFLKTDDRCEVEGFETFANGFYSCFKVMLNMLDFGIYGKQGKGTIL